MRWIVTAVLFSTLSFGASHARADSNSPSLESIATLAPTAPQVPAPQVESVRATASTVNPSPAQSAAVAQPGCSGGCAQGDCNGKSSCLQKLKEFFCYHPTAGNALPKLKVHPYIQPWVGSFGCTSLPGSACCSAPGGACGGKRGCIAANPNEPSAPEKAAVSVDAGIPIGNLPAPQSWQGFSGRGCQGGTSHYVPIAANGDAAFHVESGDYRPVESIGNREVVQPTGEFVSAVLIEKQVVGPVEAMVRVCYRR